MSTIGILERTRGVSKTLVGVSLRKHFFTNTAVVRMAKKHFEWFESETFSSGMMHPNQTEPDGFSFSWGQCNPLEFQFKTPA